MKIQTEYNDDAKVNNSKILKNKLVENQSTK